MKIDIQHELTNYDKVHKWLITVEYPDMFILDSELLKAMAGYRLGVEKPFKVLRQLMRLAKELEKRDASPAIDLPF